MSGFVNQILQMSFNTQNDCCVITGDFNVSRFDLPEFFTKKLIESNPAYKKGVELLDREYEEVMVRHFADKFTRKNNRVQFEFANMMDETFPDQNVLTFGDFKIDPKTKERVPLETVLTAGIEQGSEMGLDYIVEAKPQLTPDANNDDCQDKDQGKPKERMHVKPSSVKVDKFLVEDLIKSGHLKENVHQQERAYTQLSDHYGVSCVIKI